MNAPGPRLASLLLALFFLGEPVARAQTLDIKPDPSSTLGFQDGLDPGRIVRLRVSSQSSAGPMDIRCTPSDSLVQIVPGERSFDLTEGGSFYVYVEPTQRMDGRSGVIEISCEQVGGSASGTFTLQATSGVRAPGLQLELLHPKLFRTNVWWPLLHSVMGQEDLPSFQDAAITWSVVEGQANLFQREPALFDSNAQAVNMVHLDDSSTGPIVLMAHASSPNGSVNDSLLVLPAAAPGGGDNARLEFDPGYNTVDKKKGQEIALRVRPGATGRLRVKLIERDRRKALPLAEAYFAVNWGRGRADPYQPLISGGSTVSSGFTFPRAEDLPRDDSPRVLVWGMNAPSSGDPEVVTRDLILSVDGPLPSIYGCAQGPGGHAGLAGYLVALLLIARLLARRRTITPLAAILLLLGFSGRARAELPQQTTDEQRPSLAYTGILAPTNADPAEVQAISEYLQTELIARGRYQVVGPAEIQALLGLEAQKQLLGCNEDASSCLSEIGGALGASRLLSGNVTRVGASVILTLSLLDVAGARLLHRAGKRVKVDRSLEPLLDVVPALIDEILARDPRAASAPDATPVAGRSTPESPPPSPDASEVEAPQGPQAHGAFAAAHRGAGTFLVGILPELGPVGPASSVSLGLRWRRSLLGLALSLTGPLPGGEGRGLYRDAGARLGVRLYPLEWGRVAPFVGAGLTLLFPSALARVATGAEIALGKVRFTASLALEILLNDRAFFQSVVPLFGLGAGYAF